MLNRVIVKNFAIIEDLDLNFNSGMTVLTGQTGAGKSLIIDAIGLLLGARADLDMIRYGKKESLITGYFSDLNLDLIEILKNEGIKVNDTLVISRTLNISGKSTVKVNENAITLTLLKRIGLFLGDIHVQHDTYRLINKENYLSFIDDFKNKEFLNIYNSYNLALVKYRDSLKLYKDSVKKKDDLTQKLDYLKFQKEELEALNLKENLDIELENEINKLANFDKIYQALNQAYEIFDNNFNLDYLSDIKDEINRISDFDNDYLDTYNRLDSSYYELADIKSFLYKAKDSLDFDPAYLEELEAKSYSINKAKDKYHMSLNELIEYLNKITLELNLSENFTETIAKLKNNLEKNYDDLVAKSLKLKEFRKKKAFVLEKEISKECLDLDLEHTNFKVSFNEVSFKDPFNDSIFKENGIDDIDFLVSFNLGEPLKPLAKVASGGELSRMMLAFKTIYLKKNKLSFMVFDEIDSGVSGLTARKIAAKMHEISKTTQILAITHLAQVASISDNHLFISKEEIDGRTKTNIELLEGQRRIEEIAIMLSGLELSVEVIDAAKALLERK